MILGLLVAATVCVLSVAVRPPRPRASRATPRARRRTPTPTTDDWSRWLDTAAAHVRGGDSLRVAVGHAHAHHRLVGQVVRPDDAFDQLVDGRPTDGDEAVVVQVLAVAACLGGAVAATLQAGAALLHERAVVRAEARAHAAQARLSARVLTAVPLMFAAWNLATSATFRDAVCTPVGAVAAAAGAVLSIVGWWWMQHVVRRVTR